MRKNRRKRRAGCRNRRRTTAAIDAVPKPLYAEVWKPERGSGPVYESVKLYFERPRAGSHTRLEDVGEFGRRCRDRAEAIRNEVDDYGRLETGRAVFAEGDLRGPVKVEITRVRRGYTPQLRRLEEYLEDHSRWDVR